MTDYKINYIVIEEKNGKYKLISKRGAISGILPIGSYLTVELNESIVVLYVVDSGQTEVFTPSYLLADLDLTTYSSDQECKNVVEAIRIHDNSARHDGLIDYIKPQTVARLSTNSEINEAVSSSSNGVSLFPATYYNNKSMKVKTSGGTNAIINIPFDVFWHQIQITGKTGSGKTVASKYLANNFINNKVDGIHYGCVLAVNVKDIDFLQMNLATTTESTETLQEWSELKITPEGCQNYEIFYNGYKDKKFLLNMGLEDSSILTPITLSAKNIEPNSLLGIIQNLTNLGVEILPDVFRHWQIYDTKTDFHDFLNSFQNMMDEGLFLCTDITGKDYSRTVNQSTATAILQRLRSANAFFENENSKFITAKDILKEGKLSVINVQDNIDFGSIILRFILSEILKEKNSGNQIPILIIIDEVHSFYNSNSTSATLGDLDTICRIGRSKKIGVIFSTQNVTDLPKGISQVVNSKFEFKSDEQRNFYSNKIDLSKLKSGYSYAQIHGVPSVNFIKFPVSKNGVI